MFGLKFNAKIQLIAATCAIIAGLSSQANAWGPEHRHTVCANTMIRGAASIPRNTGLIGGQTLNDVALSKAKTAWRNPAIQAVARETRIRFGIGRVATSPPGSKADNTLQALVENSTIHAKTGTIVQRCWRKGFRQKCSFIAQACATIELNR